VLLFQPAKRSNFEAYCSFGYPGVIVKPDSRYLILERTDRKCRQENSFPQQTTVIWVDWCGKRDIQARCTMISEFIRSLEL